ncbi:hydantoinase B/oxoprolinase family protein [Rhodovibrionaceae bacterium A322]
MTAIDPISLEILWTRLTSVVDEAAATFVRASFSTLVREANDYAVVLTDALGQNLAQSSQSIPSFIATVPASIRIFIREFGLHNLREGDAYITNDPWYGSGHLNDATIAMPIFHNGKLVAFAGVVSHLPDIGGRLRNPSNKELFEEGFQIPPLRLLSAGQEDTTLVHLLRQNVRVPEETLGDVWAMVACCQSLGQRLTGLLDETGIDLQAFAKDAIARTEKAMRQAIAEVPDGSWTYCVENDGPLDMPGGVIRIKARVDITGDAVRVDYSGSSDQVSLAINTVLSYTFAYSAYALKTLFAPWIPNNEGAFKPLTVTAPEGSILNPIRPAPCGARGMIGHLLPTAIYGALASALPDRVQASPGSPSNNLQIASLQGNRRYAVNAFMGAGQGASQNRSGTSAISFPSNLSNTPIEVMEGQAPIAVHWRKIMTGSGGKGLQRGGDGLGFAFRFLGDSPAIASFMINRVACPAAGLKGGQAGRAARFQINGQDAAAAGQHVLTQGDEILIETGGGGGYGQKEPKA